MTTSPLRLATTGRWLVAAAASIGANVAATTAGTRATRVSTRAAASTPRLAPKQRRSRPHRGAPPQPRSLVRRNVASRGSANDEGTDADDKDPSGKDERSSIRAPGSTRPPERGTGIAREFDMIVDFDAEEMSCPACGHSFPTGPRECPDCGLFLG